jgi:hypothetical protein
VTHTTTDDALSRVEPEAAAPDRAGAADVRADQVEIVQGGANRVDARTVTISQGGAGIVRATEVSVSQGGIGLASAERVSLEEGSSVVAVAAGTANLGEGSNVMLLIARRASGDVRPLLDWRAMLALGAGFGLVVGLLRRR